jgi:hypothetical protein
LSFCARPAGQRIKRQDISGSCGNSENFRYLVFQIAISLPQHAGRCADEKPTSVLWPLTLYPFTEGGMHFVAAALAVLSGLFYAAEHHEIGSFGVTVCQYGSPFCDNPSRPRTLNSSTDASGRSAWSGARSSPNSMNGGE